MENKLTVENLEKVMADCLYSEEELTNSETPIPKGAILLKGLVRSFCLHPERTRNNEDKIVDLLKELPDEFSVGGGWTFLNMPKRKDGSQWGEQHHAEALMILGLAVEKIKYCIPKEFWKGLPGGVPYLQVMVNGE